MIKIKTHCIFGCLSSIMIFNQCIYTRRMRIYRISRKFKKQKLNQFEAQRYNKAS